MFGAELWIRINWIRIRIQLFKWIRIQAILWHKKKFLEFFFFNFPIYINFVWLWRNFFKTEENIWKYFKQIFKKVIKYSRCLNLWSVFQLLDPDPDCESGSGSRDPVESGSNPDPQLWFGGWNFLYWTGSLDPRSWAMPGDLHLDPPWSNKPWTLSLP